MKWLVLVIVLCLWAGYAAGHDRKPVPRWYHPAINALYAGLLLAVMWL